MPAKSKAQQRVMAIAEHHPEELYKRNRSLLKMRKKELHKFASTKRKGLPSRASQLKKHLKKKRKR